MKDISLEKNTGRAVLADDGSIQARDFTGQPTSDSIVQPNEADHRRDTVATYSDSEAEDNPPDLGNKTIELHRTRTHTLGILKLRAQDDADPTDWWFASTAIPLIAATFAPMANLLSIAALVVYWRNDVLLPTTPATMYSNSVGYADPHWCTALNAASLACGFVGNLFLLFNFTKRVRYIIALPVTIVFFYLASGILMAIIICMAKYVPPGENQVYSQGYWHAIIAAVLYFLNSMILMVNMWGYFLGHYPQNFTLSDEHRNLILQTMLFFIWLGGGAGVFARVDQWTYPDALYFCDVTILTIGFGDYVAQDDVARGLVFPYSVGGTIILGLMVSSIHKFAGELSKEKVIRKHVETRRVNTLSRAITMEELDDEKLNKLAQGVKVNISRPSQKDSEQIQQDLDELVKQERLKRRAINFQDEEKEESLNDQDAIELEPIPSQQDGPRPRRGLVRTLTYPIRKPVTLATGGIRHAMTRNQKQILMIQERDRFNAMRSIQTNASNFKRYYALTLSIISFGMLWCLGAMVFYFAEQVTQQLNYFECLYFCYVSLLTIGYGDLSPRSNSGKAFFVVWSLIAVPMMTILISDLGDTVIGGFKRGVLKNDLGLTSKSSNDNSSSSWRSLLARVFAKREGVGNVMRNSSSDNPSQFDHGKQTSDDIDLDDSGQSVPQEPATIEELASEELSEAEMMRRLAFAIRRTADDLAHQPGKKYSYEDWVQFTRLIKFSKFDKSKLRSGEASAIAQLEYDEAVDGVVEWDWLDTNSPMTSEQSESEWILDRLCESLLRVFKKSDLVLGGLDSGKILHEPGKTPEKKTNVFSEVPQQVKFSEEEKAELSPAAEPRKSSISQRRASMAGRRSSDAAPRSPDMMSKMTKFFQGEDMDDDNPQWSKRAKAKMLYPPAIDDAEPRMSQERRRSSTAAPLYKRHGPFAQ